MPWFRSKCIDVPNQRSSHLVPTPRGGGLVFVSLYTLTNICVVIYNLFTSPTGDIFYFLLPISISPLAIIGFFDDRFDLTPLSRLLCQILFAMFPILYHFDYGMSIYSFFVFSLSLLVFVSVTNFINFMDGLDGLVALCMLIVLCFLSFLLSIPWPILSLLGSLVAFLWWNWSPAKIFMGDVGSTFLGALYASFVISSDTFQTFLAYLLICSPLLMDSSLCVLRRLLTNQSVYLPHRLHLYQRLHQSGIPQHVVTLTYATATLSCCLSYCLGGFTSLLIASTFVFLTGLLLDRYIAFPFTEAN